MSHKKRNLAIVSILLVLLIGLLCWPIYRQIEQERKDQALIAAIKAGNDQKALKALAEGANGEARDSSETATFRETLLALLNHLRHPDLKKDEAHPPALVLLCMEAEDRVYRGDRWEEPDKTLVRALLDHGAKINDRDRDGKSPLHYASAYCRDDFVRLLLERGADIEARDREGATPLMDANLEATEALLEHGANAEAAYRNGKTVLGKAAWLGYDKKARILLEHGANIEAVDNEGQTALLAAVEDPTHCSAKVVRILLEYGANAKKKGLDGRTALDNFRSEEDLRSDSSGQGLKIAALLRKFGAK